MNEDWRLKRATELFGAPFPAGSNDGQSVAFDRRGGERTDRRTGQPDPRGEGQPERRNSDPAGRRTADRPAPPVATPVTPPVVALPAATTATAWPWRWRALAAFLILQTGLIVWLLVGRTGVPPRVVFVAPPAAPPAAVAPTPALPPAVDPAPPALPLAAEPAVTMPPVAASPLPAEAKPKGAVTSANPRPATALPPRARPRPTRPRATAKPAIRPAAPSAAASVPACVPGAGRLAAALCAEPALRRLDEGVRSDEAAVVAHGDRRLIAQAAAERTRFTRRRDKCGDAACIARVYTGWIAALVRLLPAGAATPPICQPGQHTRPPSMDCWPSRLRDTRPPFYSK